MLKKLFVLPALLLMFSLPAQADVNLGQNAPDFTLKNSKGADIALSSFKGKTVVLEWTNHDCPFVRKFYDAGKMQEYQKKAAADDVVWLSIISSAPGKEGHVDGTKADELTTSRNAAPAHVLLDGDGKVGRLYGAKTTPHMFVIDKNGMIQYMGAIDSIPSTNAADIEKATNYVMTTLEDLKAGKTATTVGLTRPYGCSVKYAE